MSICHIFHHKCHFYVLFIQLKKEGEQMSLLIKNAETLFERFESKMEVWAEKLF
jgi:hypothetical protein